MLCVNTKENKKNHFKKGSLIVRKTTGRFGVMIKESLHDGYYYVFSEGCLKEWHISNIDVR